jgi:hypothetical protein
MAERAYIKPKKLPLPARRVNVTEGEKLKGGFPPTFI